MPEYSYIFAKIQRCNDADMGKSIMEQARDMIITMTLDGYIMNANPAALAAYGYAREELEGLHIHQLRAPETRHLVDGQLKMAHRAGITFRTVHLRKNGEAFPVEVGAQRVSFAEGEFVVSIIRDITDTVLYEKDLQNKETKIRNLYVQLMNAHRELTESEEKLRQQYDSLLKKDEDICRQNTILQVLHDTALGLIQRHDLAELLQRILRGGADLVGTPHGFINLLDQAKEFFYRSHVQGIYSGDRQRRIPVDQGISGMAYRTGGPVVVNDYAIWRKNNPISPQFREIQAVLQIPLKSEGLVIGTIGLAYCEAGKQFSEHDIEILNRFAELASLAVDNGMLVASCRQELLERKEAEVARATSEAKYRAVFEAANEGIFIYDYATGVILDINDKACGMCGYNRDEILGEKFNWIGMGESPYSEKEARQWSKRTATGKPQLFEWRYQNREGQTIWVEISLTRATIGATDCIVAIVRDIADRKLQEQEIHRRAYYDELTGLPNRVYLQERLSVELAQVKTGAGGAVLFVDMDDMKMINDTLGHSYGDAVIIKVGAYLFAAAGEGAVVARVGGDEFIVLLPGRHERKAVAQIADDFINLLSRDYEIGEHSLYMSASIGIVVYPEDGTTTEEIFKNIDLALYAAKGGGKNSWRFFEAALQNVAYENMVLKRGLREAVLRRELTLCYQPLLDIRQGGVYSFEALLRWSNSVYGSVPPSRFIPLAEESDAIQGIGKWVIEEACLFAARLSALGQGRVKVSVNVSPCQLVAEDFLAVVQGAISRAGIQHRQLEIEITENALIASLEETTHKLKELSLAGVGLSLDDFGTGYSSLTYLRRLPVETLKMDKSFIDRIATDDEQWQFIAAIIHMAHILRMEVVAEGVETKEQLDRLVRSGCDFIQGYYYSHPLAENEAISYLLRQPEEQEEAR